MSRWGRDKPVGSELGPDGVGGASNFVGEPAEEWEHRFTRDDPRFFDRYIDRRGEVVFCGVPRGVTTVYTLTFRGRGHHRIQGDGFRALRKRDFHLTGSGGAFGDHAWERDGRLHDHEQPVLIDQIKVVYSPEGRIPSLVWLQPFDRLTDARPNALYLAFEPALKPALRVANGEAAVTSRFVSMRSLRVDRRIDEVIQGRPQVVDRISEDQRDTFRDIRTQLQADRRLVTLTDRSLDIQIPKSLDCIFKVTKVLFGPTDLGYRAA